MKINKQSNSQKSKIYLSTFLFGIITISTMAQEEDYIPFDFSKGNVWENHYIEGNQGAPKFYPYIFYATGRDTLILDKKYHIIDYNLKYYGDKKQLYIREDTMNKKLYVIDSNIDKINEKLFLDFNVYEGDSMIITDRVGVIKAKLKKKERILISGKSRKKYYLGEARYIEYYGYLEEFPKVSPTFRGNYLIEGIGSRVGLDITEFYHILLLGSSMNLIRCYNKETIELTAYPCKTLTNVEEGNRLANEVVLYPNPTFNILTIKSELTMNRFTVFDGLGTKVLETKASESIDVSALPAGLYLLEAIDSKGYRVVKKFEKR